MRSDRVYIDNISQCIHRIETYTVDGHEAFISNSMIQDAVIRNFEIIGESTKQLSQSFKDQYPEIQWRRIAGFRDVLIHDYMLVDLEEVWGIVENYLPDFKQQIQIIKSQLSEDS